MNGTPFIHYKIKLFENNRIFTCDGFKDHEEEPIKPYDIIEDMEVVGLLPCTSKES